MAKTHLGDTNLSDYALVSDRITLFYQRFPSGRIVTKLHSNSDRVVIFRALVYRGPDERRPAATGWASEREGDGEINQVACLENTETSAVGRALANLGFTASHRRPSREEMEKSARARARLPQRAAAVAEPIPARASIQSDPVQRRANAVLDVLTLLERAEAIGFPARRGEVFRAAIRDPRLTRQTVMRIEQLIRAWMARHRPQTR